MFSMARSSRRLLTGSIAAPSALPRFRAYSSEVPDHMSEGERAIHVKLAEQLEPSRLYVRDTSGGCGSMYTIEIASKKFKGINVVKQHRMVNEILKEEIKGWHGLQLVTKAE
ncbi:hypothetical protein YB2330_004532 [Saitoella coloradoensis]